MDTHAQRGKERKRWKVDNSNQKLLQEIN